MYQQLLQRTDLSDDEKGEIFHGLGRVFIDMNTLDDAARILNKVFGLKHITETWIQPWTRYYLAVIASRRGDTDLAKQYIDLALDADNYDYKMWLTFRAERLKERL
jgi:tetratricopeptide (TPR) repeat protein